MSGRNIRIPSDAQGNFTVVDPPSPNVPLYGIRANTIRVANITLDKAQTEKTMKGFVGNFIWVIDASSLGATADIKFDHDQGNAFPIKKGFFLSGVEFNKLVVSNSAQASEYLTIFYGVSNNPPLSVVNPSQSASTVSLEKPTKIDQNADETVTAGNKKSIVGGNQNRRMAYIHNLISNAGEVRVGDKYVGTGKGIPLQPGETIVLEGTESIWVQNDNGVSVDIAYLTIED